MQVTSSPGTGWDDFEPRADDDVLLDLDDVDFSDRDLLRDDRIGLDDPWFDLGVTVSVRQFGRA